MNNIFWSRIGKFLIGTTLIIILLLGFFELPLMWLIFFMPSYLLGFYLYRLSKYNPKKVKIHTQQNKTSFIFACIIIFIIMYAIGKIAKFIADTI
jgi:hypothetical protein